MSNRSLNKVILIGYLGHDPETKYTTNGSIITKINLATSETWKDKKTGENKEKTEWHKVIFFGKIAEISSELLRKGSHVYIEGQIQTRKWKDKNDNDKYITEIIVGINGSMKILNNVKLNDSKNENNKEYDKNIDDNDFENIKNDFNDDDIPF